MATSAAPARREDFATLQAGRGLAALLVVLYHADRVAANPAYWGARIAGGVFGFGHAGVEFFFVLSGFIIAHVHGRDMGRPDRLGHFLGRRVKRIYPLYWLVLAGVTVLALAGPRIGSLAHVDLAAIAASIALAGPDAHAGVLTVSWTLFHEMLFYTTFALLIVSRRLGGIALAAWASLMICAPVNGAPSYLTSPLNLLFAAGVLAQVAVARGGVARPLACIVVGVVGFVALGVEEVTTPLLADMTRNLLYGFASAVGLAGAVAWERSHRVAVPRLLLTLGAASYSLYLVHYPALSAVAVAMRRTGILSRLPASAGEALMVVAVVALGVATHVWVERPLLAGLRGRTERGRAAAAAVTAAAAGA